MAAPAPTPTATPVPIVFDQFFDPTAPKMAEPVWYEITDVPERWPELVSLPRTVRDDDGSFVEGTRADGTRVLTGRFYFSPSENYANNVRDDLAALGFVTDDYFENAVGTTVIMSFGDSRVEIMSALGYAIVDVIE